ncbi:Oxidoreductase [Scheffersomyces spartinae]|uniref:Mitochondrial intermembrane space import and assembly protein 40 n=1 Tax=Scheffersomyces spartinae TaxID=45513 RepID=A0A9P8AH18_9ASCO|nr:Oxidoreductase [Scheffersomyces spartinae]KAG7192238.1 Oxidoreductase [Scheffersomyces spartinae]
MFTRVGRVARVARVAPRVAKAGMRPYSTAKPTSSSVKITLGVAVGLLGAEAIYLLSTKSGKSGKSGKASELIEAVKVPEVAEEIKSVVAETTESVSEGASQSVAAISEAANAISESIPETILDSETAAAISETIAKLEVAVSQLEEKFDGVKDPKKLNEAVQKVETKLEQAVDEVVGEAKSLVTEESEDDDQQQQAAYNPETGEINWDCPCLGGMAHGPCGEEFKAAFSCFVYSESEPKGMDCIEKFELMRTCFRKYPEVYREQLYEDDEEPEPEPVTKAND